MYSSDSLSKLIKEKSYDLGFSYCGISKAEFLEEEAPRLEAWLKSDKQGEMSYMNNHFDKRLDPRELVPGSKSVISLLYNYSTSNQQKEDSYKVSKYAYGVDYHFVVKSKLKDLVTELKSIIGDFDCRVFVDTAPVMDKVWAKKSGLGWIGKNSNLIHPKAGSYFFIAEIICDLELNYDGPIKDFCGTCTKCIDACPTEAITPYVVDGSKCISYLTIELKNQIPESFTNKLNDWIFGCDICMDVCPWNRFSTPHNEPLFQPSQSFLNMSKTDWEELSDEVFSKLFKNSPIMRTKKTGLDRNINFVKQG
jgi:epoxyqueuosine reductase